MKVKEVNIEGIVPPEIRMRHSIDLVEIGELAASIEQVGLLQPIVVKKNNEKYEIVAGERRYLAMKELGKSTIPCYVVDDEKNPTEILKVVENIQKVSTTPLEEADMIIWLKGKYELSSKEIAHLLGKSEGWVSQRLAVERWEDDLYFGVKNGKIKWSVAREIDAEEDPEIRADLIQAAIDYGLSVEGVAVRRNALHGIETQESEATAEEQEDIDDLVAKYKEKMDTVRCIMCDSVPGVCDVSWVPMCQHCLKKTQIG